MGRTGSDENKQANAETAAMQKASFNAQQSQIAGYNKNLASIEAAGNPYTSAAYKGTERLMAAEGAGAANTSGREAVDNAVGASGTNAASEPYYRAMMAKNAGRAAGANLVQQNASDTANATQWQQWLANAKLAPVTGENAAFSTSTSGRDAALNNLTQFGLASYGPVNAAIGAAGAAGAAGITKCWIAAELYGGMFARKTQLVRFWLNNKWAKESRLGSVVMALYGLVGRQVAKVAHNSSLLRRGLQPLFDLALNRAIASALRG